MGEGVNGSREIISFVTDTKEDDLQFDSNMEV
jgi:hypothetical protein